MSRILLEEVNLENANYQIFNSVNIEHDLLFEILNKAYDIFIQNNNINHLLRQYREIKASSNEELLDFIDCKKNYINICAYGSGYSTWWLYRNHNGKKYFVNTSWNNIVNINIDSLKFESFKNFQFQEVNDEKIFELKIFF